MNATLFEGSRCPRNDLRPPRRALDKMIISLSSDPTVAGGGRQRFSREGKQTMTMRRVQDWILVATLASAAGLVGGCGKKDEPASMDDITGAIESPTGTVEASTAVDIGYAFEESMGVPSAGQRDADVVMAQSTNVSCTVSGNISVDADSSGESAEVAYNNCCEAASCCIDGVASVFYDASGSGTYQTCADYDLSYDCEGLSTDLAFSYCLSAEGVLIYVIEISGDTFAVSGSMVGGTGSLTITGENGTFTCDYTDYTGSCTGTGGTFTF